MESWFVILGWIGMYAPTALGAIGSAIGCARAGQTACGAMLDTESGHGRFVGLSALPSTMVIYGIVVMFALQGAVTLEEGGIQMSANGAGALFGIGTLSGLALMISAIYQGNCCASAINTSKAKPEVFGLSIAPAAIVEGFAVFAMVFALALIASLSS